MSDPVSDPVTGQGADAVSLVEAARGGDADAWRALYDRHAGRLLLWLRQLPTGDPGVDADDLAMEAWTLAATRIADFHGSDDDFAGWLFTVARNHLMNVRRRTRRRATYATETVPDRPSAHDEPAGAYAESDLIRRALASLPRREGEVLACVEVIDLDVATTAQVLGISAIAVRAARRRGLARLRRSGWSPVSPEPR